MSSSLLESIYVAIVDANVGELRRLLNNSVDVNSPSFNENPLLFSCVSLPVLKMLITEYSADVNVKDSSGTPYLLWLSGADLFDLLRYVVDVSGADFTVTDSSGWSVLHYAVFSYSASSESLRILKGKAPILQDNKGRTALSLGARMGKKEKVRFLVDTLGLDVNAKDLQGITPLHLSIVYGNFELTRYFLDSGADYNLVAWGSHVVGLLCYFNNFTLAKYIITTFMVNSSHYSSLLALFDTLSQNDSIKNKLAIVSYLVSNSFLSPAEIKTSSWFFHTFNLFHLFIQNNYKKGVGFFVNEGVDVSLLSFVEGNNTSYLTYAKKCKQNEIFDLLSGKVSSKVKMMNTLFTKWGFSVSYPFASIFDLDIENSDGDTLLIYAVTNNKIELVKELLLSGANPLNVSSAGKNAFHLACYLRHLDIIELILQSYKHKNFADLLYSVDTNEEGDTGLHILVINHNIEGVKKVFDFCDSVGFSFDLEKKGQGENTLLSIAASRGYSDLVAFFIEKGADVNCVNRNNGTPFLLSVDEDAFESVKLLHATGKVDINYRGPNLWNALFFVKSSEVCTFLLAKGCDPLHLSKQGISALQIASLQGNLEVVKVLFSVSDTSLLAFNKFNLLVFLGFCDDSDELKCVEVAKYLLTLPKFSDFLSANIGRECLSFYIIYKKFKLADYFLSIGVSIDSYIVKGGNSSTFFVSILKGSKEAFDYCLENNASLYVLNFFGHRALDYAIHFKRVAMETRLRYEEEKQKKDLYDFMRSNGFSWFPSSFSHSYNFHSRKGTDGLTAIQVACKKGNFSVFKTLLDLGSDPLKIDSNGKNSLYYACEGGNLKIVKYLVLTLKMDVNTTDMDGRTASYVSCFYGRLEILKFLVSTGADLSIKNHKFNVLPFHVACQENRYYILKYLATLSSFDFNATTKKGGTGLALFCRFNDDLRTLKLLISIAKPSLKIRNKYGYSCFGLACAYGNIKTVIFFFDQGFFSLYDINLINDYSPLHTASFYNKLEVVKYLLSKNASLSVKDKDNKNPVQVATGEVKTYFNTVMNVTKLGQVSKSGTFSEFKEFLDKGYPINYAIEPYNPLYVQSILLNPCVSCVRYLIKIGADLSIKFNSKSIFTLLIKKLPELTNFLISYGYFPSNKDISQVTNISIYNMLLSLTKRSFLSDGFVNLPNSNSQSILRVFNGIRDLSSEDFVSNFHDFILSVPSQFTEIFCLYALKLEKFDHIKYFFSYYSFSETFYELVSGNTTNINFTGNSPVVEDTVEEDSSGVEDEVFTDLYGDLVIASGVGSIATVQHYLKNGANIESINTLLQTSLITASMNGHKDTVKLLLDNGANLEAEDKDGKTALLWASYKGYTEIVKLLLENGANIEVKDNDGDTSLILASYNGHKEIFELLLKNGANIESKDNNGITALSWASYKGHKGVVKLLLENGSDVNAEDEDGNTALIIASYNGYIDTVELLLENGSDVNAKDNNGNTALILASYKGYIDIVELLLENGANIEVKDDAGYTALYYAKRKNHNNIVELLTNAN